MTDYNSFYSQLGGSYRENWDEAVRSLQATLATDALPQLCTEARNHMGTTSDFLNSVQTAFIHECGFAMMQMGYRATFDAPQFSCASVDVKASAPRGTPLTRPELSLVVTLQGSQSRSVMVSGDLAVRTNSNMCRCLHAALRLMTGLR